MFKFVIFSVFIAITSAGIIPEHHGLHTLGLPSAHGTILGHPLHHHHHDPILAHSPIITAPAVVKVAPVVKYVSQPVVKYVAQPIVKVAEPIVLKSYPGHHHHHHAIALPALHGLPHYHLASLGHHHHHHDILH